MASVSTASSPSAGRTSALPVRVLAGLLTTLAVVAAASAVVEAVRLGSVVGPHDPRAAEPTTPVVVAETVADAVLSASGDVDPVPSSFTLGGLTRGEVAPAAFVAFWEAALGRIRTAPCPTLSAPTAPGTTRVVVTVGATPPAHLGDAYPDYAPLVDAARVAAAERCAP